MKQIQERQDCGEKERGRELEKLREEEKADWKQAKGEGNNMYNGG